MSSELMIKAWKNPEFRMKQGFADNHPSGKGFEELTHHEMAAINGAADASPNATPTISAATIYVTAKVCASLGISAGVSAISGIVSFRKGCLG